VLTGVVALGTVAAFLGASGAPASAGTRPAGVRPAMPGYSLTRLVSDKPGVAEHQDTDLVNAWGLAAGPETPWWVGDNGTALSTIYGSDGTKGSFMVRVKEDPTGVVFNGGSDFVVTHGMHSGPSLFLFDTEAGQILGWNPTVPPPAPSTKSFVVVDKTSEGAIFKGLAIASTPDGDRLYAADFHNAKVDVFDGNFTQITTPGQFTDPNLPKGYAPFGIQAIGSDVFVTYAKQVPGSGDEADGRTLGFVDEYDTSGMFVARVASRGVLNAPWGLAMAPSNFGRFSNDLLVGNFGNGKINAYSWSGGSWKHAGKLRRRSGTIIKISGLWAIQFGNGGPSGAANQLFFTAGPGDESHGLFGVIEATG
jgi:uncharacterized protein (TIGR03118 family)